MARYIARSLLIIVFIFSLEIQKTEGAFSSLKMIMAAASGFTSNGSLLDDDCSSLAAWTDTSSSGGAVTQETFLSESAFKWSTGGAGGTAIITQDVGSFGNRIVVTIKMYITDTGSDANAADAINLQIHTQTSGAWVVFHFTDSGLYRRNDAQSGWQEIGTDLVVEGAWQTWTFDIDATTPTDAQADIYIDNVLKVSNENCERTTGSTTEGQIVIESKEGSDTTDYVMNTDFIKVGDAFE